MKIIKYFLVVGILSLSIIVDAQPYNWNQLSLEVSPSPLDLRVNRFGDIQIWRDGDANGQLYHPNFNANGACSGCWRMYNGVFMVIDDYLVVSFSYALDGYDDYWIGSVSGVAGSGTEADPWKLTANYTAAFDSDIKLDMVYIYVDGKEYFDIEMTPTLPAGNTDVVKMFHIMDTYLSSSDDGPAYTSGAAPYDVVGVTAPDGSLFEAFVKTGTPWDRYCSHDYYDALNEPYYDGELSNTLDTNANTDNAIGVQWTLGVVSGVQPTISYRIGFTDDIDDIVKSCNKFFMNRHIGRIVKKE